MTPLTAALIILCGVILAGSTFIGLMLIEEIQYTRSTSASNVEPIKTFDLGYQDGKNETYNPQPGRWKPDYDEGYKLGIIARSCNCPCGVQL